ncbi:MAG TPA: dihydroorotate dehydrogenase-like protein [Phycisphaerae bacterium]|nr:dihydroorotate dehydrogenase-like protein [Phycisphaerales bacterium]HRX85637.1 dihydroorotate dehydrogenase-like protein [Phycisphaerae bacterium]
MDLSTNYLGLDLKNPLVAGASPLSREVATVRELEDAGVAAVVMYSLFEEQIEHDATMHDHFIEFGADSFAEALSYVPQQVGFPRGPDEYLDHIAKLKAAVDIPIIASLNGTSRGGWIKHAALMEEAGADALELNLYYVAADADVSARDIEERYIDVVREVKRSLRIPVAVKLGAHFSAFANFARQLDHAGADGLVLFNRFYQPDIDLENLDIIPDLRLSAPHEMRLPLRWIAILDPLLECSLAATTGIYTSFDVLKMMLVGADVTMLVATLLRNGVGAVGFILEGMREWMEDHEYASLQQMQGSMNQLTCPNPVAFERGNYMRELHAYRPNI